jgi:peptidoglycan/xylan/chitin deacetylase (PgdA/CDA1 family)
MNDPLVLCYHALSETWEAPLSVRPDQMADQVGRLVDRGWTGLTLTEALARPRPRTFAVTFDDAFGSVGKIAKPLLDGIGVPATVFVPTAWPGRDEPMTWPGIDQWTGGPHEHELACMGWDELAALADAGWEIGSHTVSHPHLTQLDDERLAHELTASKDECERALGRPCPTLAYPYGDVDDRVAAAAARAGYQHAVTLAVHAPDPLRWPRVGLYNRDSGARVRLKLSPAVYRVRATLAAVRQR